MSGGAYEKQDRCTKGFGGDLRERDDLENLSMNIKIDLQEVGQGGMDWTDLAQDRERW
jgi:hypothetical protein